MKRRRSSSRIIAIISNQSIFTMDLQMLTERGRVGVGFITSPDITIVGFIRGMNMHMFLSITGVGKSSVTTFNLTLKRFLA